MRGDTEAAIAICDSGTIDLHGIKHSFHYAAGTGMMELIAYWIEGGSTCHLPTGNQAPGDTESNVTWWTPLHTAVVHDQYEVAKYLLEHGADSDEAMTYWTPLLDAIGNEKMCRLLKRHGAKESIFTYAARGDLARVRARLKKDAEAVNTRDEFNRTPIFYARHLAMVELLIERGADVAARENRGKSILCTLMDGHYDPDHDEEADREIAAIIRALAKAGADVNVRNKRRVTPLHHACRKANLPAIKELFRLGADINARDCEGETPLFRVVNKPAEHRIVKYLLAKGADPTVRTRKGKTPSQIAKGKNRELLTSK